MARISASKAWDQAKISATESLLELQNIMAELDAKPKDWDSANSLIRIASDLRMIVIAFKRNTAK